MRDTIKPAGDSAKSENTTKYNFPSVGCHIDESCGSADDCNERTIRFAESYGFKFESMPQREDVDGSQELSELADSAIDYLNTLETRSFMYWGFEDNSLYLMANIEGAKEDCDFVSSKTQDYPDDDYEGEWLHISDHGNATLYVREGGKDKEIWGVV